LPYKLLSKVILGDFALFSQNSVMKNSNKKSLNKNNSLSATQHELKSIKNKQRLHSAIRKINNKATFEKDLIAF
jgi:hypothetical protein